MKCISHINMKKIFSSIEKMKELYSFQFTIDSKHLFASDD